MGSTSTQGKPTRAALPPSSSSAGANARLATVATTVLLAAQRLQEEAEAEPSSDPRMAN